MAPAHFYSHRESDALAWLSKHIPSPRSVKSQNVFSKEDDFLPDLQGRSNSSACGGRSLEQPLFKQYAPLATLQQPEMRLGWGQQEESTSWTAAASHTTSVHDDDAGDDLPHLALADLSYQFGMWSHNRRESVTCTLFAVVRALQQAHGGFDETSLSQQQQQQRSPHLAQGTSAAALSPPQHSPNHSNVPTHTIHPSLAKDNISAANDAQDESARSSRRAAMIAKAKSNPSSGGVIAYKSASQKRAALQKHRNRKPIADTSSPTREVEKGKTKPTQQMELRYENTPEGYRTAVTLAIQQGLIKANDDDATEALMKTIKESTNEKTKDSTNELGKHINTGGAVRGFINGVAAGENAEVSGTGVKAAYNKTEVQDEGDGRKQRSKGKKGKKTGAN